MHRFISSVASSSFGRAGRPAAASSSAEQPATSLRSAEQPAIPSHLKLSSIRDVQRWLAEEPIASCSSVDSDFVNLSGSSLSDSKIKSKASVQYVLSMQQNETEKQL